MTSLLTDNQNLEAQVESGSLKAGVYHGVRRETYDAIEAANQSRLHELLTRSAMHARWLDEEQGEALMVGTAFHTAVLEPSKFATRYVSWPKEMGNRAGAKFTNFCNEHPGQIVLTENQWDLVGAMADVVLQHPEWQRLLSRSARYNEVVLVWQDPTTGLWCKALQDMLIEDSAPTIVDLKSAENASLDAFSKSTFNYGYDMQAAMYVMGKQALQGSPLTVVPNQLFFVVEKDPPHIPACYTLQKRTMRMGWRRVRKALDMWAECVKTGVWPGYPTDIQDLEAPEWALKNWEQQEATQ